MIITEMFLICFENWNDFQINDPKKGYSYCMSKNILVSVAWPYASGSRHLGHIGGAYLPADIFARYHRTVGNKVLMVSGSDVHGTPITVRADAELSLIHISEPTRP